MSRTLSATAAAALFKASTGEAPIFLVTFDHDDWASPIRMANNMEAVVSGGETFFPFPFELSLPGEDPERESTTTITACNVDRQMSAALDALSSAPSVTVALVLASTPNVIELGPAEFSLRDYQYSKLTIEGSLSYEDVLNEMIPAGTFNPGEFRGLF